MNIDRNTLIIVDSSNFLHIGNRQYPYSKFATLGGYRTGAIFSLLNSTICNSNYFNPDSDDNPTFAFVFDRKASRKDGVYKESRKHWDYSMLSQARFVEKLLLKAGFNVYYKEDTEADDIIRQLVTNHSRFNGVNNYPKFSKIIIRGSDKDALQCVDQGIEIHPSKNICYSVSNFEQLEINTHGDKTLFNTIALAKTLRGDTSDEIPILRVQKEYASEKSEYVITKQEYYSFLRKIEANFKPQCCSIPIEWTKHPDYPKELFDKWGKNFDYNLLILLSQPNDWVFKKEAINRYLKYFKPKKLDLPSVVVNPQINCNLLAEAFNALGMKKFCKYLNLPYTGVCLPSYQNFIKSELAKINSQRSDIIQEELPIDNSAKGLQIDIF